jgi:hypothetical protein
MTLNGWDDSKGRQNWIKWSNFWRSSFGVAARSNGGPGTPDKSLCAGSIAAHMQAAREFIKESELPRQVVLGKSLNGYFKSH